MATSLAGKVAIVTGASSGIGRAIALALASQGMKVCMASRSQAKLEDARKEVLAAVSDCDDRVIVRTVDVCDQSSVGQLVSSTKEALGEIDVLINNAGVMYWCMMEKGSTPEWEQQVDVICKGTMHGIGAVLPDMTRRQTGHIVNISSDAGRKVFPGLTVYSACKFFVEALSQGTRVEVADKNVKVTSIQPGNVDTPLQTMSTDQDAVDKYGAPTGNKMLEPRDIANAVVYALSQPDYCAVNEIMVEPKAEPV